MPRANEQHRFSWRQDLTIAMDMGIIGRQLRPGRHRRLIDDAGDEYIDFLTADYFGYGANAIAATALIAGAKQYGAYQYVSPLYCKCSEYHNMEGRVAKNVGTGGAAISTSASLIHFSVIPGLIKSRDFVFADERCHQSIRLALRATPRCRRVVLYRHNDVAALRSEISRLRPVGRIWIISEGVFSMDGDYGRLTELQDLALDCGAWLYIDDSHGIRITGVERQSANFVAPSRVLYVGGLSKSLGCPIAFVAGPENLVAQLKRHGFAWTFSSPVPLPYVYLGNCALEWCAEHGEAARARLRTLTERVRAELSSNGSWEVHAAGGVVIINMRSADHLLSTWRDLERGRIACCPVAYPAVKRGEYRIRACVSAAHSDADIARLCEVLCG